MPLNVCHVQFLVRYFCSSAVVVLFISKIHSDIAPF